MSAPAAVIVDATEADARRWRALRTLPRDVNAKLYLIYLQALEECDDDRVPESPLALLDIEESAFYALADRAGVDRAYKYRIYKQLRERTEVPAEQVRCTERSISRRRGDIPAKVAPLLNDKPPRTTALYRWFDVQDRLLYIGISDGLRGRVSDHIDGSAWMDFAARSTITRIADRDEAEAIEIEAIKTEHPLFNQQHNSTPEARRRLVEYLIEHDRLDLLAPAVSRRR